MLAKRRLPILLLVFCFVVTVARGEDWWRFRGPDLNGISEETDWSDRWPESGPEVAWRADVGTGLSSVTTSDGHLYTMGNRDNVDTIFCLDLESGEKIWAHSFESPTDPNEFEGGPTSTPTIDDGVVFTISRSGDLFALEKTTGKVLWNQNVVADTGIRIPAWGFSGSPLVVGESLILNVGDAGVALEKRSGDVIWASSDKDAGYSSPVLTDGGKSVILGSARSYVCVDLATGEERWRQRWLTTFGCNAADAIPYHDKVFLSSGYNRGSALIDVATDQPEIVWKHKDYQNQISSSVLVGDHVYGASGDVDVGTALTCMNLLSGEIMWREPTLHASALTAAGDRLVLLTTSGELVVTAAESKECRILARHQVLKGKVWTTPVISDGKIICRGADGTIVCLNVGR